MKLPTRGVGSRIVVVGPDGAGKTTIVHGAVRALRDSGLRVRHVHFLPEMQTGGASEAPLEEPHSQAPRGAAMQVVSILHRLLRYRRAALPYRALSRRGSDLVVQERGWLDQVVDPTRYRLTASGRLVVRRLSALAPRMDHVMLLGGEARAIVDRKPELSLLEVERQLTEWESVGSPLETIETVATPVATSTSVFLTSVRAARAEQLECRAYRVPFVPKRLTMHATCGARASIRSLYRPQTARGRTARSLAVPVRLFSTGLSDVGRRAARVLAMLDISCDDFAVVQSVGRAQAVIAVERGGSVAEVVRLQWGERTTLEREAAILREVGDARGVRAPQVIGLARVDDMVVMRQSALQTSSTRFPSLESVMDAAVALRWARGGRGITHGDFTQWNLLQGDPIGIVDWESASLEFKPGVDIARFLDTAVPKIDSARKARLLSAYARRCGLETSLDAFD